MRRRVVIWALVVVVLLSASCVGGPESPIPPAAITGDNSGGAIAFYQTWRISDTGSFVEFYTQKISPQGDLLWGEKGILIGSGDAAYYWTCDLYSVSDGSGGAVVMWREPLPGGPPYSQPHVAKIDSGGNIQWEREIPGVDQAIPDGSGGVIIAYCSSFLKVDAEGRLPWGEDGVSLDVGGYDDICSDNSGGVIVVGHYTNPSAQRVDSGGNTLWQTGGVQVCVSWPASQPHVVSDGVGGAIIAYEKCISCGDGSQGCCDLDIYAQRIDAEGNVLWGPDGVPVCVEPLPQQDPGIVDDGAGGAIVFFVTHFLIGDSPYPAIHARRIDADGHKLWNEDVVLWPGMNHFLVSDGSGGAISVWYGDDGIGAGAQRLDAAGRKLWGPEGTPLTFRNLHFPLAVPDGCGGVFISWSGVEFTGYEVSQVSFYVQRVDPEGNLPWGAEGILLNP